MACSIRRRNQYRVPHYLTLSHHVASASFPLPFSRRPFLSPAFFPVPRGSRTIPLPVQRQEWIDRRLGPGVFSSLSNLHSPHPHNMCTDPPVLTALTASIAGRRMGPALRPTVARATRSNPRLAGTRGSSEYPLFPSHCAKPWLLLRS